MVPVLHSGHDFRIYIIHQATKQDIQPVDEVYPEGAVLKPLQADHAKIRIGTLVVAFHELQAKGFAVVTELGTFGVKGMAKGPRYELTDLALPNAKPRNLYLEWKAGADFEVVRHQRAKRKKKDP